MMGVIVDYCGDPALAGNLALLGEAPLHTAEAGKSVADRTIVYAKLDRDGDGRKRVLHIVAAGHRQQQAGDRAACAGTMAHRPVETVAARPWREIAAAHLGLGGKT